jgi:hypothetical protein
VPIVVEIRVRFPPMIGPRARPAATVCRGNAGDSASGSGGLPSSPIGSVEKSAFLKYSRVQDGSDDIPTGP